MNPDLLNLHPYPFEKLAKLLGAVTPADKSPISLSIGEPKHAPPAFVLNTLADNLAALSKYPKTKGSAELREAIAHWLNNRFELGTLVNPDTQVLPVNGTREGLFSFIQAAVARKPNAKVLMPNPFYQIYEGAAILAGAEPVYLNTTKDTGFIPEFDTINAALLKDCQLFILCSPGNPTGAVIQEDQLIKLIELADKYDFTIVSDECYSELYFDEKPQGLLGACKAIGREDFKRCMVMHSLSKRSNLPGLRSGFVAGDAELLAPYLLYRTYHGCAMPETTQLASVAAWSDETHVQENRQAYQAKFKAVLEILDGVLDVSLPDASFYLWPKLPDDDMTFCQKLFEKEHVTLLPGQFLSRESEGLNPGKGYARMALVAPLDECIEAANRLKSFVQKYYPK